MPRNPGSPDSTTVERLVGGRMDPADAPQGFRLIAGLLQEAKAIPASPVSAGDEATVSAMVAAIEFSRTSRVPASSPKGQPSRRFAKVFAAATIATLATGGVAAASGSLPDRVQDAVSDAVGIVGVEIPRGNAYGHLDKAEKDAVKEADKAGRAEARDEKKSSRDDSRGTGAGGSDQGESQGQGTAVSGVAQDPALEGVDKGSCVSGAASDGRSNAAEQSESSCASGGESQSLEPPSRGGAEAAQGEKPEVTPTPPPTPTPGADQGGSVSEERSNGASRAADDHSAPVEVPKGGPAS